MQNTYWRNNKDERRLLQKKIYLSLYLQCLCVRGSWRPNRTATYWPPQPLRTSPCVVLILLGCSTGGLGAQPLRDMFSFQHLLTNWSGLQTSLQTQSGVTKAPSVGWWLSLSHLVSNSSDLQLTHFLSTPSYIIVQSPTQSLEWHVWPGRRSIYNNHPLIIFQNSTCGIFFTFVSITLTRIFCGTIFQDNNSWKHKRNYLNHSKTKSYLGGDLLPM